MYKTQFPFFLLIIIFIWIMPCKQKSKNEESAFYWKIFHFLNFHFLLITMDFYFKLLKNFQKASLRKSRFLYFKNFFLIKQIIFKSIYFHRELNTKISFAM